MVTSKSGFAVLATWITGLGLFFALSPHDWFGPSWSYFYTHGQPIIPAGGLGLGVCLTGIGTAQLLAIWRERFLLLSRLFFLSGFVLNTAGGLLFMEGLQGHQGLMEGPLLISFAIHKIVISVSLRNRVRIKRGL